MKIRVITDVGTEGTWWWFSELQTYVYYQEAEKLQQEAVEKQRTASRDETAVGGVSGVGQWWTGVHPHQYTLHWHVLMESNIRCDYPGWQANYTVTPQHGDAGSRLTVIKRNIKSVLKRVSMQAKGILKYEFWGEYLGPRGMRTESGEDSIVRNFIVCTVHLIYSGWLSLEV